MGKRVVAAGALLATLVGARGALAQTPSERVAARHLMDDGDAYYDQKKFAEALRVYSAAHSIMHVPSTGLGVARTLAALGRLVDARDAAFAVTRMPVEPNESKPLADARREAAELDAQLDKRIPKVQLVLAGGADPGIVHASIDDTELAPNALTLPQRVDPGKRMVHIRAAGFAPVDREVDVPESTTTIVRIDLDVPRAEAKSNGVSHGLSPLAVAGLATAAVGLTVGSITGVISLGKASDARAACGPDTKSCDPAAGPAIDSSKTYGWIATASFAVAIAGGALVTYTLLSKPKTTGAGTGAGRVDFVVGAGSAGMRGVF